MRVAPFFTARLVSRRTQWREHLIAVEMGPLREIDDGFGGLRSIWELRRRDRY